MCLCVYFFCVAFLVQSVFWIFYHSIEWCLYRSSDCFSLADSNIILQKKWSHLYDFQKSFRIHLQRNLQYVRVYTSWPALCFVVIVFFFCRSLSFFLNQFYSVCMKLKRKITFHLDHSHDHFTSTSTIWEYFFNIQYIQLAVPRRKRPKKGHRLLHFMKNGRIELQLLLKSVYIYVWVCVGLHWHRLSGNRNSPIIQLQNNITKRQIKIKSWLNGVEFPFTNRRYDHVCISLVRMDRETDQTINRI